MTNKHITCKGLDLIKRFEGFSRDVYIDPVGYPTVGYGHLIKDGEDFSSGVSEEEAEALLRKDAEEAENHVSRLISVPLTDSQFDALVSFTYNLGGGALSSSTLRKKLNAGDYMSAAEEFGRWVFAGGKKLKGLINRREAEKELFLSEIT